LQSYPPRFGSGMQRVAATAGVATINGASASARKRLLVCMWRFPSSKSFLGSQIILQPERPAIKQSRMLRAGMS
jgi:hypothetical protein